MLAFHHQGGTTSPMRPDLAAFSEAPDAVGITKTDHHPVVSVVQGGNTMTTETETETPPQPEPTPPDTGDGDEG